MFHAFLKAGTLMCGVLLVSASLHFVEWTALLTISGFVYLGCYIVLTEVDDY